MVRPRAPGRSIPGFDLGNTVIAARQRGLQGWGGHAMAAGFTLEAHKMDEFHDFLDQRVATFIQGAGIVPTTSVDAVLTMEASTLELVNMVQRLGPFGSGNAEPRFAYSGLRVVNASVVGKGHIRCVFSNAGARAYKPSPSGLQKPLWDTVSSTTGDCP